MSARTGATGRCAAAACSIVRHSGFELFRPICIESRLTIADANDFIETTIARRSSQTLPTISNTETEFGECCRPSVPPAMRPCSTTSWPPEARAAVRGARSRLCSRSQRELRRREFRSHSRRHDRVPQRHPSRTRLRRTTRPVSDTRCVCDALKIERAPVGKRR
jgi:hypothetical protein